MPSSLFRTAVVLLIAPILLGAQTPQDRPTFRSGVQSIEVDVLVTDKDGNAVRGLTKDDFTLLEDDAPQQITSFAFVDLPVEPRPAGAASAKGAESDVATNTAEGRTWVLFISLSEGQDPLPTRRLVRRFVEETFGPNDQMAVIHVLDTMSKAQGFTHNRRLIFDSIDRTDVVTVDRKFADRLNFEALEEVSERLGRINGRRKAIVWFNAPAFFAPDDRIGGADPNGASVWFWMRDALRAANRNNVAIYPVQLAMGTALGLDELKSLGAVRALAEDTGGDAIVNTNNFSPAFQRVVRDNSSYYLLGYVPRVEYRDGKFHNLTVRVNRPQVTVRARRGYYAPEPDAKVKSTPVVEGLSAEAAEAVRMPASMGDLGIDLVATPFKGTDNTGSVLLGAQLRGADLALGPGERIEIAYQATTTEGKVTPGAFKVFTLDFTPESRAGIERTGIRIVERLDLPRGRHQVRFAVNQPNGKTGTVVADVEIPDYSAPLVMSGVVLGSQETAVQRTLLSAPAFKTILSSDPTTVRRFSRRDVVTAFVEVYWDARRGAEDYRATANLTSAKDGKARKLTMSVVRGAPSEPGRMGYVTRIPLADLAAGDYALTFEASTSRKAEKRQVPFSVGAN